MAERYFAVNQECFDREGKADSAYSIIIHLRYRLLQKRSSWYIKQGHSIWKVALKGAPFFSPILLARGLICVKRYILKCCQTSNSVCTPCVTIGMDCIDDLIYGRYSRIKSYRIVECRWKIMPQDDTVHVPDLTNRALNDFVSGQSQASITILQASISVKEAYKNSSRQYYHNHCRIA